MPVHTADAILVPLYRRLSFVVLLPFPPFSVPFPFRINDSDDGDDGNDGNDDDDKDDDNDDDDESTSAGTVSPISLFKVAIVGLP